MSTSDIAAVDLKQFPDVESCVAHLKGMGHDEASARKICERMMKKGSQGRRVGFVYQATFEPFEQQGKRFTKIHVIDLAPNENNWQVTAPARAKALKSLLDAPLLGPPPDGEKGNVIGGGPGSPHEGLWSPVGRFVDFESNHATHGIAEITKDYAWEKIKNQEWQTVSPSVLAFVEHQEGDVSVVDDFNFEHVLFVDKGAYPQAGVEGLCEGDLGQCNFYQALAIAYERQGGFAVTESDLKTFEKAVQSARGILQSLEERLEIILFGKPQPEPLPPPLPIQSHTQRNVSDGEMNPEGTSQAGPNQTQVPEKKEGQKMNGGNESNTTSQGKEETKLNESSNPCEQIQAAAKAEIGSLQAKVTALETENKDLKAYKADVDKKERAAKINHLVELKAKCGLIEEKDRAQAAQELEKLSADALNALDTELKSVQARFESMPNGLKAKFEGNQNAARECEEQVREAMFGYRRDDKGEVVK